MNLGVINAYADTAWSSNPENIEGFRTWFTVDTDPTSGKSKVIETVNADGSRTLIIPIVQHWNDDKNDYDRSDADPTFTYIITFQEVDGKAKVSNTDWYNS
ncbi:hypothetical protein SDC9_188768 [bioreactor metagenome]|uniref:Uncharacterized protein n=1 Tax=bioreactor metagenome TaxID=1076179 RepID=A0A645HRK6_9ZZZZ